MQELREDIDTSSISNVFTIAEKSFSVAHLVAETLESLSEFAKCIDKIMSTVQFEICRMERMV